MFANETYEYPSELPDSLLEDSSYPENPSIKAVHLYELDGSVSESVSDDEGEAQRPKSLEIVHSLDESSIEHDDFLEMLKKEEGKISSSACQTKSTLRSESQLLLVDRTQITLTLIETQHAKQSVSFTNPTANPIKMRFSDCSLQIQSDKMLGFVMAEQLEVVIEPWDKVELTFSIEPQFQSYGDIIETVVVMGEFIGREDQISPVRIDFHIHYVSPKLSLKYQGNTEVTNIMQGKLAVVSLKPNKLGEYQLEIGLEEGLSQMEVQVETRGKATVSTESLTLYAGDLTKLKLRQRGLRNLKGKERCGLMLKPLNTQICYVMGLNFLV